MQTSENIVEISKALAGFQSKVEKIDKNAKSHHGKYADLPHVIAVIKPIMTAHGLAYVQGIQTLTPDLINVITRVIHVSGEWIETGCPIEIDKKGPQAYGACISYGRRYGLQAILGLSAEDDDADSAQKTPLKAQKQVKKLSDNTKHMQHAKYIKETAWQLSGKDVNKAMELLQEWSTFKTKAGESKRLEDWIQLDEKAAAGSKWVHATYKAAQDAALAANMNPEQEPSQYEGVEKARQIDPDDNLQM